MRNNNLYNKQCPSIQDFEQALNKEGEFEFRLGFYTHMESCALCKEAFEGYRLANISKIQPILKTSVLVYPKKQIVHSFRVLGYAATIILLVGSFFLFKFIANEKQLNKQRIMSNNFVIISEKVDSNEPKKLMAKAEENYWHIGENNEIKLNDQVIDIDDLNNLRLKNGNRAIVEVASSDSRLTNEIIQKLKVEKNQTVLTYSKQKDLKRMNLNDGVAI